MLHHVFSISNQIKKSFREKTTCFTIHEKDFLKIQRWQRWRCKKISIFTLLKKIRKRRKISGNARMRRCKFLFYGSNHNFIVDERLRLTRKRASVFSTTTTTTTKPSLNHNTDTLNLKLSGKKLSNNPYLSLEFTFSPFPLISARSARFTSFLYSHRI